jgi:hypothetical protein
MAVRLFTQAPRPPRPKHGHGQASAHACRVSSSLAPRPLPRLATSADQVGRRLVSSTRPHAWRRQARIVAAAARGNPAGARACWSWHWECTDMRTALRLRGAACAAAALRSGLRVRGRAPELARLAAPARSPQRLARGGEAAWWRARLWDGRGHLLHTGVAVPIAPSMCRLVLTCRERACACANARVLDLARVWTFKTGRLAIGAYRRAVIGLGDPGLRPLRPDGRRCNRRERAQGSRRRPRARSRPRAVALYWRGPAAAPSRRSAPLSG